MRRRGKADKGRRGSGEQECGCVPGNSEESVRRRGKAEKGERPGACGRKTSGWSCLWLEADAPGLNLPFSQIWHGSEQVDTRAGVCTNFADSERIHVIGFLSKIYSAYSPIVLINLNLIHLSGNTDHP